MTAPWPNDPNGSLVPVLEASVEAAKQRHPSASGDKPGALLTIADRCDKCGAAAVYVVWKEAVGDLLFCMHHWRKNFPSMVDQGWAVSGGNPDLLAEIGD